LPDIGLDLECKSYLIIELFFLENSIKPKQNFKGKLWCPLDIIGKPSTSRILWR
jgi:hypothetical protein